MCIQSRGVLYLSEQAEILIKQDFLGNDRSIGAAPEQLQEAGVVAVLQTTIDTLQDQLAVKDKQIEELNARLAEVSSVLVTAQQTAAAAQALHAGTIKQQLSDECETVHYEQRQSWIGRLFKRNCVLKMGGEFL